MAARSGWTPLDLLRAYLDAGATFIQVRAKHLESGAFLTLCDAAVAAARPFGAQIVVNDRVDLACMAGAAGVHVGQDDVPPVHARALLGSDAILGVSTHSVVQIDRAVREPVSYIAVGPVFGTGSKDTGYEAVGLDLVREAARRAGHVPVVAIGGVTDARVPEIAEAGAAGIAAISLFRDAESAARVVATARRAFDTPC